MKKLYYLFFGLFAFFLFSFDVNAQNVCISYDHNERFNYFYEQKNQTPFYAFLVSQGDDLLNYLNTISSPSGSYYGQSVFIMYSSELSNYDFFHVPGSAVYSIIRFDNASNTSQRFEYSNGSFEFAQYVSSGYAFGYHEFFDQISMRVFYFDIDGHFITSESSSGGDIYETDGTYKSFSVTGVTDIDCANFSYFISSYYISSDTFDFELSSKVKVDFIVTELLNNNVKYLIDDSLNYNGFLAWFRDFFGGSSVEIMKDLDDNLIYFKKNKVLSPDSTYLKSFYEMSANKDVDIVPFDDNFKEVLLKRPGNGAIILVPKTNDISLDFNVYISTLSTSNVTTFLSYNISSGVPVRQTFTQYMFNKVSKYYRLPFESQFINEDSNQAIFLDYKYIHYIATMSEKYDTYIYYNPDVYDIYYDNDKNDSITFYNFSLGKDTTIKKSKLIYDYEESFSDFEDRIESEASSSSTFDFSISGIINGFKEFISGFIEICSVMISYVTLLFNSLPSEVQGLLMFGLLGGIILIFYTILRG